MGTGNWAAASGSLTVVPVRSPPAFGLNSAVPVARCGRVNGPLAALLAGLSRSLLGLRHPRRQPRACGGEGKGQPASLRAAQALCVLRDREWG